MNYFSSCGTIIGAWINNYTITGYEKEKKNWKECTKKKYPNKHADFQAATIKQHYCVVENLNSKQKKKQSIEIFSISFIFEEDLID